MAYLLIGWCQEKQWRIPKLRRFVTATNKTLGLVLPAFGRAFLALRENLRCGSVSLFGVIFKVLFKAYSARLFSPASACPNQSQTAINAASAPCHLLPNEEPSAAMGARSDEHTSEPPPLMRIPYAVFC